VLHYARGTRKARNRGTYGGKGRPSFKACEVERKNSFASCRDAQRLIRRGIILLRMTVGMAPMIKGLWPRLPGEPYRRSLPAFRDQYSTQHRVLGRLVRIIDPGEGLQLSGARGSVEAFNDVERLLRDDGPALHVDLASLHISFPLNPIDPVHAQADDLMNSGPCLSRRLSLGKRDRCSLAQTATSSRDQCALVTRTFC
jgi:hypothetical protein